MGDRAVPGAPARRRSGHPFLHAEQVALDVVRVRETEGRRAGARRGMTPRAALAYGAGNVAALAVIAYAAGRPWVDGAGDTPVPASLARLWLPFALALFALVDAAVAWTMPAEARQRFLG